MKSWFSVKNKAGGVELSIHDEIGLWGVSAKDFINAIPQDVSNITVDIHSPGGSAFDGLAMYNALKNHKGTVKTKVTGIAASAASIVLMAGDEIEMPEDAFIMIHNPWTMAVGESDDLRETADVLDKLRDSLVNIYQKQTGLSGQELEEMLNNETWLNGQDAKENGFITNLLEPAKVAALSKDFAKHFKNIPSDLSGKLSKINNLDNIKDVETYLRDAGQFSANEAKAIISKISDCKAREVSQDETELTAGLTKLLNTLNKVEA